MSGITKVDTQKTYPLTVYHANKVSPMQPIRVSATRPPYACGVVRPASLPVAIHTDAPEVSGASMIFVYTAHETQTDTSTNTELVGVIAALIVAGALLFGAVIVSGAIVIGTLAG